MRSNPPVSYTIGWLVGMKLNSHHPRGGKSSTGCLFLFSLPFAAVGVFMSYILGWCFWEYSHMQSWEEVPAVILEAELEIHHGDDSTSYKAAATYSYEYDGRGYRGDRVALHTMSDNIGSYQRDKYEILRRHERSGDPIPCYVNPAEPSESVLFPELRWEMLLFVGMFALAFGGVGFGLMGGTLYSLTKERKEGKLAAERPEEPWTWKEDWAKGEIRDSNLATLMGVGAFAALWNFISFPIAGLVAPEVFVKGNWLAALAFLFPLIGLGLLAWAGYLVLQYRKYGESIFEMASVPGVIGGKLAGVIRTNVHMRPDEGFLVKLSCIQQRTTGSGKNRRTVEDVLWEDDSLVTRTLGDNDFSKTSIPVLFGIPYDCQPSTTGSCEPKIKWKLSTSAAVPGIDYASTFEVPVFRTEESDPNFELDESPIEAYSAPVSSDLILKKAGVQKSYEAGGVKFDFPASRRWTAALWITLFAIVWGGVVAVLLYAAVPWFFVAIFGLFEVLFVWIAIDCWFYSSTVDVSRDGISLTSGLLGMRGMRWITSESIQRFEARRSGSANKNVFYDLQAVLADQSKVTLAKHFTNRHVAEAILEQIKQELHGDPVVQPGAFPSQG